MQVQDWNLMPPELPHRMEKMLRQGAGEAPCRWFCWNWAQDGE